MRYLWNVFYSSCIDLCSHQQWTFSPHPCRHPSPVFRTTVTLIGMCVGGDISLQFCFAFLWWWVMLSTFPCVHWPIDFLWKNVYLDLLPIFQSRSFFYYIILILYIFWILTLYQIYDVQISSPIPRVAFSFSWCFLCRKLANLV